MKWFDNYMIPETVKYLVGLEQEIKDILVQKGVVITDIRIDISGHELSLVLPVLLMKGVKKAKFIVVADLDRPSAWYESCFMINGKKEKEDRNSANLNSHLTECVKYYKITPTTPTETPTKFKCELVAQKLDKLLNIIVSNTRQKINPCTI